MPIEGIQQPNRLDIDAKLRLKAFEGVCGFALDWYQDKDSLKLIDGKSKAEPYTPERLKTMYEWLNAHGELYFIEKTIAGHFTPIGDVTFWQEDMPIVLSKEFRGQGIGKRVVLRLIERAKELGYTEIKIAEIYDFNPGSQKLFESCGFCRRESTKDGARYLLMLE